MGCCCYRKGTNFQANHNCGGSLNINISLLLLPQRYKFSSKSQRHTVQPYPVQRCCCYRKGTNFQANHNIPGTRPRRPRVVVATAKVQIFKQITTERCISRRTVGCCCYRKGTNFQANHNWMMILFHYQLLLLLPQRYKFSSKSQQQSESHGIQSVVVATAKVQIFKQITTCSLRMLECCWLLLLPQRYKFSSKSQPLVD